MIVDLHEYTQLCQLLRDNEQEQHAVRRRLTLLHLIEVQGKGHYGEANNEEVSLVLDQLVHEHTVVWQETLATLQQLHEKQWAALAQLYREHPIHEEVSAQWTANRSF